jgi:hypothetical protein
MTWAPCEPSTTGAFARARERERAERARVGITRTKPSRRLGRPAADDPERVSEQRQRERPEPSGTRPRQPSGARLGPGGVPLPGYGRGSSRAPRLLRGSQAQPPAALAARLPRRAPGPRDASRAARSQKRRQRPPPLGLGSETRADVDAAARGAVRSSARLRQPAPATRRRQYETDQAQPAGERKASVVQAV